MQSIYFVGEQKKGTDFSSNRANEFENCHILSETIDKHSLTFSVMAKTYARRFLSMLASALGSSSLNGSSLIERTEGAMVNTKSRGQHCQALMATVDHTRRKMHFFFPSEILRRIQLLYENVEVPLIEKLFDRFFLSLLIVFKSVISKMHFHLFSRGFRRSSRSIRS